MALESLLQKHLYDEKPSDDDFLANLEELENKVRSYFDFKSNQISINCLYFSIKSEISRY